MCDKQLLPRNAFQCSNALCLPTMGRVLLTLYPCSTYPYTDFLTIFFLSPSQLSLLLPPPILLSKFQIPFLFCTEQVSVSLLLSHLHIHTSQGPKQDKRTSVCYPSRKAVVVKRAFLVLLQPQCFLFIEGLLCAWHSVRCFPVAIPFSYLIFTTLLLFLQTTMKCMC